MTAWLARQRDDHKLHVFDTEGQALAWAGRRVEDGMVVVWEVEMGGKGSQAARNGAESDEQAESEELSA